MSDAKDRKPYTDAELAVILSQALDDVVERGMGDRDAPLAVIELAKAISEFTAKS